MRSPKCGVVSSSRSNRLEVDRVKPVAQLRSLLDAPVPSLMHLFAAQ
jgi:hypothetical protein